MRHEQLTASSGKRKSALKKAHSTMITSLALSPDGKTLASGDMNGNVALTKLATGGGARAASASGLRNAWTLAFGRDAVAVGGEGWSVRVLSARKLALVRELTIPAGAGEPNDWPETRGLAFSSDGVTLVAATRARFPLRNGFARSESYVVTWNAETGEELRRTPFSHGLLLGLAVSNGTLALAADTGVYVSAI